MKEKIERNHCIYNVKYHSYCFSYHYSIAYFIPNEITIWLINASTDNAGFFIFFFLYTRDT